MAKKNNYFEGYVKSKLEDISDSMGSLNTKLANIEKGVINNSKEVAVINTKIKIYSTLAAFAGGLVASIITVFALKS